MDRISDSGSDGWGSNPHGGTLRVTGKFVVSTIPVTRFFYCRRGITPLLPYFGENGSVLVKEADLWPNMGRQFVRKYFL